MISAPPPGSNAMTATMRYRLIMATLARLSRGNTLVTADGMGVGGSWPSLDVGKGPRRLTGETLMLSAPVRRCGTARAPYRSRAGSPAAVTRAAAAR